MTKTNIKIDKDDRDKMSEYTWWINDRGYATTTIYLGTSRKNNKSKKITMHRMIMKAKPQEIVDHINRNKLDNRKSNLRIASRSLNAHNITIRAKQGVYKRGKRFVSMIRINGVREWLGTFSSLEGAKKVYQLRKNELANA